MKLNIPRNIRAAIYIITVMGTAVIVPLEAAQVIPTIVLTVWASVAGAASGLAALNITPTDEVE